MLDIIISQVWINNNYIIVLQIALLLIAYCYWFKRPKYAVHDFDTPYFNYWHWILFKTNRLRHKLIIKLPIKVSDNIMQVVDWSIGDYIADLLQCCVCHTTMVLFITSIIVTKDISYTLVIATLFHKFVKEKI